MEHVLAVYAMIFGCSKQQALDQLRDPNGLMSALARPRNYALYEGADIARQAAVLAHGIAEGQKFCDGNKRTALVITWLFLKHNGYSVRASQDERFDWLKRLGESDESEQELVDELADWLRTRLRPT